MLIKKSNFADRQFQQAFRHDLTTLPTQFIGLGAVGLPSLNDCAELSPSGAVKFAYYGHNQLPENLDAFKQAVADDGFFTTLVKNRQRVLTERVDAQTRTLARNGLSITITDDDHDDPMLELLPAGYKKAVSALVDVCDSKQEQQRTEEKQEKSCSKLGLEKAAPSWIAMWHRLGVSGRDRQAQKPSAQGVCEREHAPGQDK